MRQVRIGAPIFLIIVGLVMYLALNVQVSGVDLKLIGGIVALVSLGWLGLELFLFKPKTTTERKVVTTNEDGEQSSQQVTSESNVN